VDDLNYDAVARKWFCDPCQRIYDKDKTEQIGALSKRLDSVLQCGG
jgi:hypothetical protein